MSPAKIECKSGYSFILPGGEELNRQSRHFDYLPYSEKDDIRSWLSVVGMEKGYEIYKWGRIDIVIGVTPTEVISNPPGHEDKIELKEGNVYILRGGTTITPIDEMLE